MPSRPTALPTLSAALAVSIALLFAARPAQAQRERTPRSDDIEVRGISVDELPGPMHYDDIERNSAAVGLATAPMRAEVDLGRHFRPRYIEVEGVAVAVALAEPAGTTWITSYGWLEEITSVEIYLDGAWVAAELVHSSIMDDLTAVDAPMPLDIVPLEFSPDGLHQPQAWGRVPITPDAEGVATTVAIGPVRDRQLAWYVHIGAAAGNGYPWVDSSGRLVAISSVPHPDGGILGIGENRIREWADQWDRLDPDAPLGWRPARQVIIEEHYPNEEAGP